MQRVRNPLAVAVIGVLGICTLSTFAALLGVKPGLPLLFFDNQGMTSYDAATDLLSVDGTPVALRFDPTEIPRPVVPTGDPPVKFVEINILVGPGGALIGGVPGDDLIVVGEVDSDGNGSIDFDGVLLTGEIVEFGFHDFGMIEQGDALGTDIYDFRFTPTGGSLLPLFAGGDVGVVVTSEQSTFGGEFLDDFEGEAKGVAGPIPMAGLGACCIGPECIEATPEDCQAAGGIFQGEGTACNDTICVPPKGACCFPDGACAVVTEQECADGGGLYFGDFTTCPGVMCDDPVGACCFGDMSCEELTVDDCFAAGGLFQGILTDCDLVTCPGAPQACCFLSGSCAVIQPMTCLALGGNPQGVGTVCVPNMCPDPVGACCFMNGDCDVLELADCAGMGGFFQGQDTSCDDIDCEQPKGACCLPDGSCVVVEERACAIAGGDYQGDFTVCVGGPCLLGGKR